MNKQVMELWVKALRSGKYRKGRNRLCAISKNGNKKWCCLGVLCELYNQQHEPLLRRVEWDPWFGKNVVWYLGKYSKAWDNPTILPTTVQEWAGMSSNQGAFSSDNFGKTALSELNDCPRGKRSFKRMADIIEKYWEQL